jgi:hypothetical protein
MSDERKLTEEDRQKIQRLLKTAEFGKVRMAIELTEETCNAIELNDIYTDEIIFAMISSGDIELFAITASFFLRHNEHWDRFLQCASDTNVLTGMALKLREKDLDDFTHITAEAAGMLSSNQRWNTNLGGITQLSIEAAQNLAAGGSLQLGGMRLLPDDIASALAEHKDELWLNGLTKLSDAAAESLGKHQGSALYLDGLMQLSDAAVASLSQHRSELSLDGLGELSDAAAQSFRRYQGSKLSLAGLTSLSTSAAESLGKYEGTAELWLQGLGTLSDAAAIALDNKSLQLPSHIDRQINAIVKQIATAESILTPKQQAKIRKLIKTNDADNVATACELLAVAAASEGDWIKLFPKTRIKELLNTFDPDIWNTLVAAMSDFPRVAEMLRMQATDRVNTNSNNWEHHKRINEGLSRILSVAHDEVIELIGATRDYCVEISAESLSDVEAAKLAKYKGYLKVSRLKELSDVPGHIALCEKLSTQHESGVDLYCLTSLSDAAAEALSKLQGDIYLRLSDLDDNSESAAKILRAAGHGF